MASGRRSKRTELAAYLERTRPAVISESEWAGLLAALAPISESYLRRLLRATGVPLAPLVDGARQESFEELERTLLELEREYARAVAAGDRSRAQACRRAVIQSKDHARWALRSPKLTPEKKAEKEEMLLWLLTWLENPGAFPLWVELRKKACGL